MKKSIITTFNRDYLSFENLKKAVSKINWRCKFSEDVWQKKNKKMKDHLNPKSDI